MSKNKIPGQADEGQLAIRLVPISQIGPASEAQQRAAKIRRFLERPLRHVGTLAIAEVRRQLIKHPVGVIEVKAKGEPGGVRFQPIFNLDTLTLLVDYRAATPELAPLLNTLPVLVVDGVTQTQEKAWAHSDVCGDYLLRGAKTSYLAQLLRVGHYLKKAVTMIIEGDTISDLFRAVGSSPNQIWALNKKIENEKKKQLAIAHRNKKKGSLPAHQAGAGYDARRIRKKEIRHEEG